MLDCLNGSCFRMTSCVIARNAVPAPCSDALTRRAVAATMAAYSSLAKKMSDESRRRSRMFVAMQFLLIAIFAGAVFLDRGAPRIALPDAMPFIGLALCALGIAMGAAALVTMGRIMQVSPEPKPGGRLVTRGVYRYLRHPMYTSIVLIVIGLWLREPTAVASAAGVALIVLLVRKSRFEEGLLQSRYPEYADYRGRTWGVVPGTGRATRRTDAGP